MRWLMVDRFTELVRGKYACAIRNVTLGEDHVHDHFPGFPTWPRSLMIEGLAQTGGVLVGYSRGFRDMVILAKVERMSFYDLVVPGDQMTFRAELEELRDEGAKIRGEITVGDKKVAEGSILYAHVNPKEAPAEAVENFVFNGNFLSLLGIQKRDLERWEASEGGAS
ncbi:MAG: 3-hydroxyacyl-ACP dehydratase FabZ family protein [Planctomycetota bacterium]